jgi:Tol biopolymer transport system component
MWSVVAGALAAPALPVAAVEGANLQRPTWAPDGSLLAFEANFHADRRIETWLGPPREGGFAKVGFRTRPTSRLTEGFTTAAPAGGRVIHDLAFTRAQPGAYVFVASNDLSDYDLYYSAGVALAPAPGADGNPVWSPDGTRLVFTSARTGEGDLYVLEARAIDRPPERLTALPDSSEVYPDWSADGRSVVFVAHSKTGDNLWWVPAPGEAPTRLTSWPGNQIRPRFSPTEARVAFYANHERTDRWDLYVATPGAEPTLLFRGVHPDVRGPSFTADGRHLVFVADDDDALDPVMAVASTDPARVARLDLGTVGNGDLALTEQPGSRRVAVVAKGRTDDPVRDFDRLFVAPLPPLP